MNGHKMDILVFGQLQEITGTHTLNIQEAGDTTQLSNLLFERYPRLRDVKFAIAVDRQIVAGGAPIKPNASIALLPPFSGG